MHSDWWIMTRLILAATIRKNDPDFLELKGVNKPRSAAYFHYPVSTKGNPIGKTERYFELIRLGILYGVK